MTPNEGNFQYFHGRQGNGQQSTVGFINQQDFLVIEEALRVGSVGYIYMSLLLIFFLRRGLQGQIFKLLLPENSFILAKIYFKPNS